MVTKYPILQMTADEEIFYMPGTNVDSEIWYENFMKTYDDIYYKCKRSFGLDDSKFLLYYSDIHDLIQTADNRFRDLVNDPHVKIPYMHPMIISIMKMLLNSDRIPYPIHMADCLIVHAFAIFYLSYIHGVKVETIVSLYQKYRKLDPAKQYGADLGYKRSKPNFDAMRDIMIFEIEFVENLSDIKSNQLQ